VIRTGKPWREGQYQMTKKQMVVGGCGFIGSHIVNRLHDLGHDVVVIDDLSASENNEFYFHPDSERVTYHRWDISKDNCSSAFTNIDCVFHLAARSRIQPTIQSPSECFEVNVVGTQRVLEWSRINSVRKLIYSGTSSLYGHQNSIPFQPNMPPDCLNPYSMSKWMGEQTCKLYSQLYDLSTIVLRYFNVYGPQEPTKGQYAPVIGLFKRQVANGESMTVVGDGSQRRDFTYVSDVVDANVCAMNTLESEVHFGVYNVGTGANHSINEVAGMIGDNMIYINQRPAEVQETLADIEATKRDLGWVPTKRLEDMIMSY